MSRRQWTFLIFFHFSKSNSGFDCFPLEKSKNTDRNEMTTKVWADEPAVEIYPNSNAWQFCKSCHSLGVFYANGLQMSSQARDAELMPLCCKGQKLHGEFSWVCLVFLPGELYFLSTGVPSATAPNGVVYKVVDTSRYEMFLLQGVQWVLLWGVWWCGCDDLCWLTN